VCSRAAQSWWGGAHLKVSGQRLDQRLLEGGVLGLLELVLRVLVDALAQLAVELVPRHPRLDAVSEAVARLGQVALLHLEHIDLKDRHLACELRRRRARREGDLDLALLVHLRTHEALHETRHELARLSTTAMQRTEAS
jgi:hypothetical protein